MQTISPSQLDFGHICVCGSYQKNRTNDKICEILGNELAELGVGLISAGGVPAQKIMESMDRTLTALSLYDPSKIITVFRKKTREEEIRIKRFGTVIFIGNNLDELREYILSKSKVVIVIGGATKTKEEVLLAQDLNIPVIPVAITGGTAYNLWLHYQRTSKFDNHAMFTQLNNKNYFIAASAVTRTLANLINCNASATVEAATADRG
jgi:predicted Rossmann-fold nucleotide-binding protein